MLKLVGAWEPGGQQEDRTHLELDAVYDPHLLEEGGLAALAGPEQQELDLPAERLSVLLQHPVDLLALVALLDLLGAELEPEAPGAGPGPWAGGHLG